VSAAQLSSMAASLEDITRRCRELAAEYESQQREDVASDLFAVERGLEAALRRLSRVVSDLTA